jgi:hypothetical protein
MRRTAVVLLLAVSRSVGQVVGLSLYTFPIHRALPDGVGRSHATERETRKSISLSPFSQGARSTKTESASIIRKDSESLFRNLLDKGTPSPRTL